MKNKNIDILLILISACISGWLAKKIAKRHIFLDRSIKEKEKKINELTNYVNILENKIEDLSSDEKTLKKIIKNKDKTIKNLKETIKFLKTRENNDVDILMSMTIYPTKEEEWN